MLLLTACILIDDLSRHRLQLHLWMLTIITVICRRLLQSDFLVTRGRELGNIMVAFDLYFHSHSLRGCDKQCIFLPHCQWRRQAFCEWWDYKGGRDVYRAAAFFLALPLHSKFHYTVCRIQTRANGRPSIKWGVHDRRPCPLPPSYW